MRVKRAEFDRMVEEAIAELPGEFARWLEEVPVIVEDRVGEADLGGAEGKVEGEEEGGEVPLGMYAGPTLAERGVEGVGGLPGRVMIYREPLMEACTTREQLAEEIRKTLWHELGHYAGLDEEDLERLGYGAMEEEIEWDVDDEEE